MSHRLPLWKRWIPYYPLYNPGNPQLRIFMPLFWMKLIKPERDIPPDRVQFICHPQMTKFDVKNYLEKIYNIPVLDVHTKSKQGEDIKHPIKGYLMGREPDHKLAYIQLKAGHTFEFPDIFKGKKSEMEKTGDDFRKAHVEQMKTVQKDWQKLDVPTWFR